MGPKGQGSTQQKTVVLKDVWTCWSLGLTIHYFLVLFTSRKHLMYTIELGRLCECLAQGVGPPWMFVEWINKIMICRRSSLWIAPTCNLCCRLPDWSLLWWMWVKYSCLLISPATFSPWIFVGMDIISVLPLHSLHISLSWHSYF